MTVALNEAGIFTWSDWAAIFGPKVQQAEADAYWSIWSDALIELLSARGLTDSTTVDTLTAAWHAAARATPHGQEITLPSQS